MVMMEVSVANVLLFSCNESRRAENAGRRSVIWKKLWEISLFMDVCLCMATRTAFAFTVD